MLGALLALGTTSTWCLVTSAVGGGEEEGAVGVVRELGEQKFTVCQTLISTSCQDFCEQPRMLQNCLELFKFHLTLLHLTSELFGMVHSTCSAQLSMFGVDWQGSGEETTSREADLVITYTFYNFV